MKSLLGMRITVIMPLLAGLVIFAGAATAAAAGTVHPNMAPSCCLENVCVGTEVCNSVTCYCSGTWECTDWGACPIG